MANHPTMRTRNGRWTVEVITTRAGQSFRVKDLQVVPGGSWSPTGKLVRTVGDVRALLGKDFDSLVEVLEQRFDGVRRAKQVGRFVARVEHQKIEIKLVSRTIATASAEGAQQNAGRR